MQLIDLVKSFLSTGKPVSNVPDGKCPNCWGHQEYGAEFYKVVKNRNMNVNEIDKHKGWVQEYADNHLAGITIKKHEEGLVCEKCKLGYIKEEV